MGRYDSVFKPATRLGKKEPKAVKEPVRRSDKPCTDKKCWSVWSSGDDMSIVLHCKSAEEIFESCTSVKLYYFNDPQNDVIINWNNVSFVTVLGCDRKKCEEALQEDEDML